MNITQVMLAKSFGGAERLFVDFCLALAESGENIQAICQKGSVAAALLDNKPGVKLDTIRVLGNWDLLAKKNIRALLKQHSSDVVQAHLARGALLAGKACADLGLPLVVTTHNYVDLKYYKYVTMLVPPTQAQLDYYVEKGFPRNKTSLIRHFSPLTVRDIDQTKHKEALRFVSLGRFVEKKGFDVLLRAFAGLKNKNLRLELGGSGPEQAKLEQLVQELELQDRVRFSGWVENVRDFLGRGDIFVLPSRDEPFGIVVLEAMAAGIPIVSTKTEGPLETLDEDTAWLCEINDDISMQQALEQTQLSDAERLQKANNAQQKFLNHYCKEAIIPQFKSLYADLSAAKTRPFPG